MRWRTTVLVLLLLPFAIVANGCSSKRLLTVSELPGVRLINDDVPLTGPAWSPDGTRIAAVTPGGSVHGGLPSEVYMIDMASGRVDQVTDRDIASLGVDTPSWSFNGKLIAYHSEGEEQGGAGIYVIDSIGGLPRRIAGANTAVLSPTSDHIALWKRGDNLPTKQEWLLSIVNLINLNERIILKLDAGPLDLGGLSWSRDAKKIAFSLPRMELLSSRDARYRRSIYVIDVQSGEYQQISNSIADDAISPTWSPDGRYIAYVQGSGEYRQYFLWIMNADGSCPVQLLDVVGINTPAWSPNGQFIVFDYDGALYTLDLHDEHVIEQMKGLQCE